MRWTLTALALTSGGGGHNRRGFSWPVGKGLEGARRNFGLAHAASAFKTAFRHARVCPHMEERAYHATGERAFRGGGGIYMPALVNGFCSAACSDCIDGTTFFVSCFCAASCETRDTQDKLVLCVCECPRACVGCRHDYQRVRVVAVRRGRGSAGLSAPGAIFRFVCAHARAQAARGRTFDKRLAP